MPIHPKTKEKVTWKQFFQQWKQGMRNITPLQQTITTQFGQIVSGIGVLWGIFFSIRLGYYWMMVILIGGLIVLGVQYLANYQMMQLHKERENLFNNALPEGSQDTLLVTPQGVDK